MRDELRTNYSEDASHKTLLKYEKQTLTWAMILLWDGPVEEKISGWLKEITEPHQERVAMVRAIQDWNLSQQDILREEEYALIGDSYDTPSLARIPDNIPGQRNYHEACIRPRYKRNH